MSNIQTCKCSISPIVRYINTLVMDGERNIFLCQFKEQLGEIKVLPKLNACLAKHGFKGVVIPLNNSFFYSEEH